MDNNPSQYGGCLMFDTKSESENKSAKEKAAFFFWTKRKKEEL